MKKKLAFIALIIAISLALLCAAYIVFHMICSTAHLAKHIRFGMTYDQVVKLMGEPYWKDNNDKIYNDDNQYRFNLDDKSYLDNGNNIMVIFDPQEDNLNAATVYGFWFSKLPKAEIGLIVGAVLLVCAIGGTAALLISRKLKKQPNTHSTRRDVSTSGVPMNNDSHHISLKGKWSYIALVVAFFLAFLCISSIVFHMNCGTAHLAKHVRLGMSYHELLKLLGEPDGAYHSRIAVWYHLDDGNAFRVYLWGDEINPDAQWEDAVSVHGYEYINGLPKAETGLVVGAVLLVCVIGGAAALLISRKLKQPTAQQA